MFAHLLFSVSSVISFAKVKTIEQISIYEAVFNYSLICTCDAISVSATNSAYSISTSAAPPVHQRQAVPFDVSDYGVSFQADTRLIVMMAALDAAGFDPQPGREPTPFRAKLARDMASLDPDLRQRMRTFFERNRLPAPATPADQASRYVSLGSGTFASSQI